MVDILIPNEHEAASMGGVDHLRRLGVHTVIVTEGPRGCRVFDHTGERRIPSFTVDAIDTTGAGDSFCGALSARLALGSTIDDALVWAGAAGALATTVVGAVPSIPRTESIAELIRSQGRAPQG